MGVCEQRKSNVSRKSFNVYLQVFLMELAGLEPATSWVRFRARVAL
jgi:hypothetical protein